MRATTLIRMLGRIGVLGVALVASSVIGVQYARVIGHNVALGGDLKRVQHDVEALKVKRAQQQRDIRRLSDPHGAVPEVHDRLHLVGDHEAIIYVKHGRQP